MPGVVLPAVVLSGARGSSLVIVSSVLHCDDVLSSDVKTINLPEVSERWAFR